MKLDTIDWYGLYGKNWRNEIVSDAFSHPAKFARGLIRRIYAHALERGYLQEGQTVLDPFGGVALGALDAMFHGLHFIGCELEDKFVQLGQQNIDLWNQRYGGGRLRRWGTAVILQGDSRRLCEVLEGARAEGLISSPPWQHSESSMSAEFMEWKNAQIRSGKMQGAPCRGKPTAQDGYGTDPAQLGDMPTGKPPSAIVSSPPYIGALRGKPDFDKQLKRLQRKGLVRTRENFCGVSQSQRMTDGEGYSIDPANLGNMPTGELPQAVIAGVGHDAGHPRLDATEDARREAEGSGRRPAYGQSDGQLAAMREGDVDAVIASPPYIGSVNSGQSGIDESKRKHARKSGPRSQAKVAQCYGHSDGQLAALPEGEPPQVDGIVASPPFQQQVSVQDTKFYRKKCIQTGRNPDSAHAQSISSYGTDPDNLGNMKEGEPPAGIVSSPPHEGSMDSGDENAERRAERTDGFKQGMSTFRYGQNPYTFLSKDPSGLSNEQRHELAAQNPQIGALKQDTFWAAARAILLQCHAVLAPGGVAIFVTKRFVRDKTIVEFSQQWADLCQSCGFELIEWIKAWLVEERGTQYDLTGEAHTKTVKRFSFFRRLHAQKYPHLAIEWEDVIILRKSSR